MDESESKTTDNTAVTIRLNGEVRRYAASATPPTLAALVESLGLQIAKIAVECNRTIIPRSTLHETPLSDGDAIEIVHFVGGG